VSIVETKLTCTRLRACRPRILHVR